MILHYKVKTTAVADKGKANSTVISLLSEYFQIKKNAVHLLSGIISREKYLKWNKVIKIKAFLNRLLIYPN